MELGFVSSILEGWTFEEMIDVAASLGFKCVEVACWPNAEKAERRYAGVCHIDTEALSDKKAEYILEYCDNKKIKISSLAYYPNPLEADEKKREETINHLMSVIDASAKLGVNMVTTFIGRDQTKNIEENLHLMKKIWMPILEYAKEKKVKIAIENCPMLFGADQWPGGQNLMTSPKNWDKVFDVLDSEYLGINFDPSHFVWQMMDYIAPVYKYKDKIFHVHFKDIKLYQEKLAEVGILSYPLDYMTPKIPGLGDVNWSKFISALTDIGYEGYACIEVEDRAFEGSSEKVIGSLEKSKKYLEHFSV